MGKISLFVGWTTLLGLSLYFAWATRELRGDGRDAVARVSRAAGSVYQRPANISVYEIIGIGDSLFHDDYISTGARSSVELELYSGKTLVVGENSLIHLTFGLDESGVGSDIVTLLKGDMLARGGKAGTPRRKAAVLRFNVGKNFVEDADGNAGIQISKKVEDAEATVTVVTGSATIRDANDTVQDVKTNDVVKLLSPAPAMKSTVATPVVKVASVKMPVIKVAPQAIVADDKLISSLPSTLKSVNLASIKPIETAPPPSALTVPVEKANPEPISVSETTAVDEQPKIEQEKPKLTTKAKPKKRVRIAAVSPKAPPPVIPYAVVLRSANPAAFTGPGIYLVRNQTLFAKITGKPTTENLLKIKQKYGGQLLFRGNAQAFSGAASLKALEGVDTVFAVSGKGIQQIDAKLIRTRPVALDLLVEGGYTIFKEKIDLINVGH